VPTLRAQVGCPDIASRALVADRPVRLAGWAIDADVGVDQQHTQRTERLRPAQWAGGGYKSCSHLRVIFAGSELTYGAQR
jgi:hypothetical protein